MNNTPKLLLSVGYNLAQVKEMASRPGGLEPDQIRDPDINSPYATYFRSFPTDDENGKGRLVTMSNRMKVDEIDWDDMFVGLVGKRLWTRYMNSTASDEERAMVEAEIVQRFVPDYLAIDDGIADMALFFDNSTFPTENKNTHLAEFFFRLTDEGSIANRTLAVFEVT